MKRNIYFGCSLLMTTVLATAFAIPLLAQDDGTSYAEFFAEQDQAKKATMGEKFLVDYKQSQYVDPVYRTILRIYYKANNWPKVLDLAGKLDQLDSSMEAKNKPEVYSLAMDAAQKSNNAPQVLVFGEKILGVMPDDFNALSTLSSTILFSSPNDPAAIDKAAGYAARAMTVLGKLDAKNLGLTDAEWAKQKVGIEGTLHNTLGSIAFNKHDYDKSIEELTSATKLVPNDGTSWYYLGFSYYMQNQDMTKQALAAINQTNEMIKKREDKV